jgi:23S rRNA pseudouridine1911/1915/1917 synthase
VDEWRLIGLDRGDYGVRIDRVLWRHLRDQKGISRNRIQRWISAGDVLINGRPPSRPAWRVRGGDEVRVRISRIPARAKPQPEEIALDILYEDDDLLVVNKPPGLVVHPSYRNTTGTLLNGLLARARSWPEPSVPTLVGRLDKFTSGAVLVAKRRRVHAALQRAAAANRIEKDYIAIVHGRPTPARGTIDLALDRDPWDRRRVTVTDRGGQPSITKYERLSTRGAHSAVRCRLITGRMHQIRVHLAAKGWPIVGDAAYSAVSLKADIAPRGQVIRPKGDTDFPRQALHAWRLRLRQPRTGEPLNVEAPLPADMRTLAEALGLTW